MTKAAATSAMRLTITFTAERMSNVTAGDVIATGCTPSDSFAFVVDRLSGSWLDNCMTSTTTAPAAIYTLDDEIRYWEAAMASAPASELRQRDAALNTLRKIAEMDEDAIRPNLW